MTRKSSANTYDDLLEASTEDVRSLHVHSTPARLNLSQIMPNSWNPHQMTEEEQTDLERSVLEDGQWRPILVIELDVTDDSMDDDAKNDHPAYRIVDGEHLFHAITSLFLAGKIDDDVACLVLGKNSELPVWKQQEIGQTINHGMRGSQEDPDKTRAVLGNILRYRKPEVVAKRMGLGVEGVKHLTNPIGLKTPRAGAGKTPLPTSGAPTMAGAVKTHNAERKSYTIALVFEEADELKSFEERISQAADELEIDRSRFQGKNGQFRISTLVRALELAIEGPPQEGA